MHLRQSRFTYSACGPFTKNKEKLQKFKETGDSRHIYQNKLHKVCFKHDMVYGDFKDLTRRAAFDEILHDKVFDFAKNPKKDIEGVLIQWFINLLIKKTSLCGLFLQNIKKIL